MCDRLRKCDQMPLLAHVGYQNFKSYHFDQDRVGNAGPDGALRSRRRGGDGGQFRIGAGAGHVTGGACPGALCVMTYHFLQFKCTSCMCMRELDGTHSFSLQGTFVPRLMQTNLS